MWGRTIASLSRVCRTCLCEKSEMRSLYDGQPESTATVADMLVTFATVQLAAGEGLPEKVCGECTQLIEKCFAFKRLCEKSESVLRCIVNNGELQEMKIDYACDTLSDNANKYTNGCENEQINGEIKKGIFNYESYLNDDFHEADSPESVRKDSFDISNIDVQETNIMEKKPKSPNTVKELNDTPKIINKAIKSKKYKNSDKVIESIDNVGGEIESCGADITKDYDYFSDNNKRPQKANENAAVKNFTCDSCGKQFPSHYRLARHNRIHQEEKLYNCLTCKKGFNESRDYRRHVKKHEIGNPAVTEVSQANFPCHHCHLSFTSEGDLYIHSSVHNATNGKNVCQHCKKEFGTSIQLKRHVRTHLSDKPHKCALCNKGFSEMGSLTRHFRRHTGEVRERKHICNICNKAYLDRHSLKIHLRSHTGEKPWECQDCGRKFTDLRLLNSHKKTHSDVKPHVCSVCNKRFRHESTLKTHKRIHTGEKPYVCSVCGSAFIQSSNLSLHMRTHTREKPYPCEYCTKCFSSSSALTTHTRIHTGEKPYVCPVCFRRFARHDMKSHMRTHTGEKPFGCSICNRHFITPSQLQHHTRIHTGERPFTCVICGKGCITSFYLKRHMVKTHNMNIGSALKPNSTCDFKFEIIPIATVNNCIVSVKDDSKTIATSAVAPIDEHKNQLIKSDINLSNKLNSQTESRIKIQSHTPMEFINKEENQILSGKINESNIITNNIITGELALSANVSSVYMKMESSTKVNVGAIVANNVITGDLGLHSNMSSEYAKVESCEISSTKVNVATIVTGDIIASQFELPPNTSTEYDNVKCKNSDVDMLKDPKIVTNDLISNEKLYQLDPSLLRIQRVSSKTYSTLLTNTSPVKET